MRLITSISICFSVGINIRMNTSRNLLTTIGILISISLPIRISKNDLICIGGDINIDINICARY
jgi:hypothetical protein